MNAEHIRNMNLSVVIITFNEEANLGRTLQSVQPLVADGKGEIIVVDSGSTDRTVELANSYGAKVFVEEWKGYAAQKNSAIDKASGDWILNLDADEEVEIGTNAEYLIHLLTSQLENLSSTDLVTLTRAKPEWPQEEIRKFAKDILFVKGYYLPRKNFFLGRWIKHGGFWPDPKLRLFKRTHGRFENRTVHESLTVDGLSRKLTAASLIHHSYPTLSDYIEHMNRYSSLGAEMVVAKGKVRFSLTNIVLRPIFTFLYNYFFRLGFLDGREGLLLHLYHAVYVSWKYAKAWELSRRQRSQ